MFNSSSRVPKRRPVGALPLWAPGDVLLDPCGCGPLGCSGIENFNRESRLIIFFNLWVATPPDPLQSPETGNPENAIFETKKWTFGGRTWTHLNNLLGDMKFSPPLVNLVKGGGIKYPRRAI